MQTTASIFDTLCAKLRAEPDRHGEVWLDCPQCGKGAKHFSFNEHAGHCFACDYSGSLRAIAELLNIRSEVHSSVPLRRDREPVAPRDWQKRPGLWLDRYGAALDRLPAWQSYKPLSLDSIARFRLGVGVLPSSRCNHRRLILPVFVDGRVTAFHGRAYLPGDNDEKWLTAGGSSKQVLFGVDLLRPGATVIICENYVDAILAMQAAPEVVAIAGGGASWQSEWTAQIAASKPARVLVWLDHDLIGCPNRETYRALLTDWRISHPDALRSPKPRGPQIANDLLTAGVRASLYDWPRGSPAKADVGWALMQGRNAV
jgi:hypothetical protein